MQKPQTALFMHVLRRGVALIVCVLGLLSALFFWKYGLSHYQPALLSDVTADIDFFRHPRTLISFIFDYHNEHVVATTRMLSALDYVFFGSQYWLHQYVSTAMIVLLAGVLVGLNLFTLKSHNSIDRVALSFFLIGVLFAPITVPVVAFPYFAQHLIAGGLGLCMSIVTWLLYRSNSGLFLQSLLMVVSLFLALSLLATSGHGIVVVVGALLSPLILSPRLDRRRIIIVAVVAGLTVLFWRLWFSAAAAGVVAKMLDPHQWLGIADYYIRILSLPAYFATSGMRFSRAFGVLVFVASMVALVLAFRNRRRDGSLITAVAGALWIGHQLSIILVSVGRSGTGWDPEDPKYAFYTSVIIASSAILLVKNLHRGASLLAAGAAMASVLGITLATQSDVINGSRTFYRTMQIAGYSLALGLDDPDHRGLLGNNPIVWERAEFERALKLNIHMRQPGELLGRSTQDLKILPTECRSGVEQNVVIPARDGGAGVRLSGWLYDETVPDHQGLAIVISQGNRVVGYGVFTTTRRDIHTRIPSKVEDTAAIGWVAYARPENGTTPLNIFAVDTENLAACKTTPLNLPQLAPATLGANADYLRRAAEAPALTPDQRWSRLQKNP